jgi:hypothetical protein
MWLHNHKLMHYKVLLYFYIFAFLYVVNSDFFLTPQWHIQKSLWSLNPVITHICHSCLMTYFLWIMLIWVIVFLVKSLMGRCLMGKCPSGQMPFKFQEKLLSDKFLIGKCRSGQMYSAQMLYHYWGRFKTLKNWFFLRLMFILTQFWVPHLLNIF